jgi:hypothetical protein
MEFHGLLGYFRINFNIALLCHRLMELILRANKLIQKKGIQYRYYSRDNEMFGINPAL